MSEQVAATPRSVNWRNVGTFYGIAFGGAVLVALLIWALRGIPAPYGGIVSMVVTAVLYMPLPLVAGLVTERLARRRMLIADEWQAMHHRFFRTYGRNALVALVLVLAVLIVGFAVAWAAGAAGVPGAGHLVTSDAELAERMAQLNPAAPAVIPIPVVALIAISLAQGIVAGLTVNTLFAFGEEYGWRGVLADELRPLGLMKATALTGVLWGFWHAPIIVLGHNYGTEWGWGVLLMVTWTVPLAFLLTWARERTGSVLAPSMLHGLYNALIGLFALLIIGGNLLVSLPVGIIAGVMLTVLALIVWRIPTPAAPVVAAVDEEPAARL